MDKEVAKMPYGGCYEAREARVRVGIFRMTFNRNELRLFWVEDSG